MRCYCCDMVHLSRDYLGSSIKPQSLLSAMAAVPVNSDELWDQLTTDLEEQFDDLESRRAFPRIVSTLIMLQHKAATAMPDALAQSWPVAGRHIKNQLRLVPNLDVATFVCPDLVTPDTVMEALQDWLDVERAVGTSAQAISFPAAGGGQPPSSVGSDAGDLLSGQSKEMSNNTLAFLSALSSGNGSAADETGAASLEADLFQAVSDSPEKRKQFGLMAVMAKASEGKKLRRALEDYPADMQRLATIATGGKKAGLLVVNRTLYNDLGAVRNGLLQYTVTKAQDLGETTGRRSKVFKEQVEHIMKMEWNKVRLALLIGCKDVATASALAFLDKVEVATGDASTDFIAEAQSKRDQPAYILLKAFKLFEDLTSWCSFAPGFAAAFTKLEGMIDAGLGAGMNYARIGDQLWTTLVMAETDKALEDARADKTGVFLGELLLSNSKFVVAYNKVVDQAYKTRKPQQAQVPHKDVTKGAVVVAGAGQGTSKSALKRATKAAAKSDASPKGAAGKTADTAKPELQDGAVRSSRTELLGKRNFEKVEAEFKGKLGDKPGICHFFYSHRGCTHNPCKFFHE